ncbi:MAG: Uma2 family endonuclease [Desulfobacteraceae bacterium]|nr:Uma2 family endonuclease [Desulfobacteraceae bacterium]
MIQHQLKSEEHVPEIPAGEMLPTMYDLPSENPEEPGVPDQFHILQPQLLTETFVPPDYPPGRILTASDLNIYYDRHNPFNYKRPDWYAVPDLPYLREGTDLRRSYVMWEDKSVPYVVVELISPGTETEDLGLTQRKPGEPPAKWEVYEQILGIPYYVVFDRYKDRLRAFRNTAGHYNEMVLPGRRLWLPGLKIGLGLWHGTYRCVEYKWLRWYGADNNWIPTSDEEKQRAEMEKYQEKKRAESEKQRADIMEAKLRELGIDPESLKSV